MSQFAYYASSKKCNNNNNNNNVNESTCSSLKIGDKVDVFTNSFIRNETEEKKSCSKKLCLEQPQKTVQFKKSQKIMCYGLSRFKSVGK